MKSGSQRVVGRLLCIDVRPAKRLARLGITASSRYGTSCERNRFKRLVREAFRKNWPELPPLEFHIVPRQYAKNAHFQEIDLEFKKLVHNVPKS